MHTCVVQKDGTLTCFGSDRHGQCNVPQGLAAVVGVSAGCSHTCAALADGTLACFGDTRHGRCDVPSGILVSQGSISSRTMANFGTSAGYCKPVRTEEDNCECCKLKVQETCTGK